MHPLMQRFQSGLVVSCQALADEPLHGSEVMAKMAIAAKAGGAQAIRANSPQDIRAIKAAVDLPIIGLYKRVYPGFDPFITPTMTEVRQVAEAGADIVAIDATDFDHPNESVSKMIAKIHTELGLLVLADIATVSEARQACEWGADMVATTLRGYTRSTEGLVIDVQFLKEVIAAVSCPVLAEGGIRTPGEAASMLENGAFGVVVGSAITRPQEITKWFAQEILRRKQR